MKFPNRLVSDDKVRVRPWRVVYRVGAGVLCSSFTKNGHTVWFDSQVKKLEPHCIVKQTVPQYSTVQ